MAAVLGIRDILVANQIVGPIKIRRLMTLLRSADVITAVDGMANVRELDAAARQAGPAAAGGDRGRYRHGPGPGWRPTPSASWWPAPRTAGGPGWTCPSSAAAAPAPSPTSRASPA